MDRMENIESRLDKIDARLEGIAETLVRNTAIMDEHQKRSTQLEARVLPLEVLKSELAGSVKMLKIVGILVACIEGISQILRHL